MESRVDVLMKRTKRQLCDNIIAMEQTFAAELKDAKEFGSRKLKKELSHKEEMIISLKKDLEFTRESNTQYNTKLTELQNKLQSITEDRKAKLISIQSMSTELNKTQVEINRLNGIIEEYEKEFEKHVLSCICWFIAGAVLVGILWLIF